MKKTTYGAKTFFGALAILFIGINTVLFLDKSRSAETPNLGPLLVHVVNPISGEKILPTTFPLPGSPATTTQITACQGEYEPASFVFRSTTHDVHNIKFVASDLVGESGSISKVNVDIRFVKVWFQAGGGWNTIGLSYLGKSKVLVPELLLKNDGLVQLDEQSENNFLRLKFPSGDKLVSISEPASISSRVQSSVLEFPINDTTEVQPIALRQNEAKQLWITVHIPQNAKSGNYKGSIALTNDTGLLGQLEINLHVLPFILHSPKIQYSIYYRGTLSQNPTISSEQKGRTQFIAELENMFAHGVTNPTVYQRLDRAELNETLKIRHLVGMDNPSLFYLGTGTGNPQNSEELTMLKRRLRVIKEIASEHRIDTIYLYGIDEAKGEKLASQRKAWESAHSEGIKVFTAGYSDAFSLVGDLLDLLVMAGKLQGIHAQNFHKAGHKIFSYANPQTGPENPELFRRNYGLELWRNDYDGAMPYAYQDSMGFIWNDFDHARYRDHNFTYPTIDGVIDTLAWEGFREGVDDVRYVTTLEDVLEELPRPYTPPALEALKLLKDLRASLPPNLGEARAKIIYHLLQMSSDNNSKENPASRGIQVQ